MCFEFVCYPDLAWTVFIPLDAKFISDNKTEKIGRSRHRYRRHRFCRLFKNHPGSVNIHPWQEGQSVRAVRTKSAIANCKWYKIGKGKTGNLSAADKAMRCLRD
jgi:hypothetical protein